MAPPSSAAAVDLSDPNSFAAGPPHEYLAGLRATEPVFFQPMAGDDGFWAVLKHADVVAVARQPELFSAGTGGVVIETLAPEQLEMMRMMLLAMDPPEHSRIRRPLTEHFKARVIGRSEERIRFICREIMDDAASKGEVEFVHDVTSALPSRVIGELMGLPVDDWSLIHSLAERVTGGQDPELAIDPDEAGAAAVELAMYAIELAGRRGAEAPTPDLTSVILDTDFGGAPMNDIEFGSFFVQLVVAGNDTTKTMLSSGLLALIEHPEQLAQLRAEPIRMADAVEEILRWANPLHYFRRTATADTELRGVPIKAGDKVAMYYTSANRDEEVFAEPQQFDIARHPNPHLSFGTAEHFCLGVHLARLEGRVFFEELLGRFGTIELAGEPVRLRSNQTNAFRSLPVRLGQGPASR